MHIHTQCTCVASPLYELTHVSLDHELLLMHIHTQCTCVASHLCGSSCVSLEHQLLLMHIHTQYTCMASPLCGSSCVSLDCLLLRIHGHTPSIEMYSHLYGFPLCQSLCSLLVDQHLRKHIYCLLPVPSLLYVCHQLHTNSFCVHHLLFVCKLVTFPQLLQCWIR